MERTAPMSRRNCWPRVKAACASGGREESTCVTICDIQAHLTFAERFSSSYHSCGGAKRPAREPYRKGFIVQAQTLFPELADEGPRSADEAPAGPFAGVAMEQSIERVLDYSIPPRLLNRLHVG